MLEHRNLLLRSLKWLLLATGTQSEGLAFSCPVLSLGLTRFQLGCVFFHSSNTREPLWGLFPCSDHHPPVPLHKGGGFPWKSRGQFKRNMLREAPGDLAGQSSTAKALVTPVYSYSSYTIWTHCVYLFTVCSTLPSRKSAPWKQG